MAIINSLCFKISKHPINLIEEKSIYLKKKHEESTVLIEFKEDSGGENDIWYLDTSAINSTWK